MKEETGFDVRIERIVGIYSDPGHVFAYADGEMRQEFSICLACTITDGELRVSSESTDVRFFSFDEVPGLTMHESIRKRIDDYLSGSNSGLALRSRQWKTHIAPGLLRQYSVRLDHCVDVFPTIAHAFILTKVISVTHKCIGFLFPARAVRPIAW